MLKRFAEKVELALISMTQKVAASKAVQEERGDTNFISILIIMGIVILLAGIFIGFKDQIVGQVQAIIGGFVIS